MTRRAPLTGDAVTFDFATATDAEKLAEVERRNRNRAAGRAPTDDGQKSGLFDGMHSPEWHAEVARECQAITSERERLVRLRLPWSMLIADNQRFAPALRGTRAVLVMTQAYRAAKKKAAVFLAPQYSGPVITGRVRVTARFFEPDARTRRDIANYAKAAHDALTQAAVIADDSLIDDVRWIRAGVDIDAPRLELVVELLGD